MSFSMKQYWITQLASHINWGSRDGPPLVNDQIFNILRLVRTKVCLRIDVTWIDVKIQIFFLVEILKRCKPGGQWAPLPVVRQLVPKSEDGETRSNFPWSQSSWVLHYLVDHYKAHSWVLHKGAGQRRRQGRWLGWCWCDWTCKRWRNDQSESIKIRFSLYHFFLLQY